MTAFGRKLSILFLSLASACIPASSNNGPFGGDTHDGEGTTRNTVHTLGLKGWTVQSSALAIQTGAQISTPGFNTSGWLAVAPDDAGAPGTEVGAEVQNGNCPEVFFSTNMETCFGSMNNIGPVTISEFAVPWWFRTDFTPNLETGQYAKLIINGVVGQADVWVNGTEVSTQAVVEGDYARYTFDISSLIKPGVNSLALEVYPNDPNTMFTLDNVDWSQIPPDNNTGIQFPIELQISPALGIGNAHVLETNAADMSQSALTVKSDITNNTGEAQTGTVWATISAPHGGRIHLSQTITVPASTTTTVSFNPSDYPQLTIHSPEVWWPYQMGNSPLYELSMGVSQDERISVAPPSTFGIRTIAASLTPATDMAPKGVRVFAVNGVPFLFRAGGWAEDMFLRYSSRNIADQIMLIKDMGLNGIRTEGKEMPDDFYEQLDRAGIMVDSGFQCCDAWQLQGGPTLNAYDYAVLQNSAQTIGERLRNHPSVINYSWSDNNPTKKQETVSLLGFAAADFQDPIIASAEYKSDPNKVLGPSGEKEGPYDWVPTVYWYDTTHEDPTDSTLTNVGGSWGFDSEESGGHMVPTMDSLNRFLSSNDLLQLWTNPGFNQYHANYEPDLPPCPDDGGYCFGTLYGMDLALQNRYGSWTSLPQYVQMAQVQNYEDTRAQFEAFIDHWTNTKAPTQTQATGTVYWQMNKGWPTLLWALYNHDYDQAGNYFGAKKANQVLHALFAYDNQTVTVDNLSGQAQDGLSVESNVWSLSGARLDHQITALAALAAQGVANAVITPVLPAVTTPPTPAQIYFVELILRRHGTVVDRNVYWLSTQQDLVDWPNTIGNPAAAMLQYADLSALQSLPNAHVTASARSTVSDDSGSIITCVTITNTSKTPTVGFFLRADVRYGDRGGAELPGDNEILPIAWSDNDITIWPGESVTLTATYSSSALHSDETAPVVSVYGWNVPRFDVVAPW